MAALVGVCVALDSGETIKYEVQFEKQMNPFNGFSDTNTTVLESYHSSSYFIFHCDDCKVNSSNTAFMLQSNLAGLNVCMYLIGQCCALSGDSHSKS